MEQLTIPDFGTDFADIRFQVLNCSYASALAGSEYWSCDFAVMRGTALLAEFRKIMLREQPGRIVYICGIQEQSGLDKSLGAKLAANNQKFIKFLRQQTAVDRQAGTRQVVAYQCEREAMMAYMQTRGLLHPFGVGFYMEQESYHLVSIECR